MHFLVNKVKGKHYSEIVFNYSFNNIKKKGGLEVNLDTNQSKSNHEF